MAVLSGIIRRNGGTIPLAVFAALLALMLLAVPSAGAQTTTDYDDDNDRLIEIDTPAKLNAIRHDLDGDGLQGSITGPAWANYIAAGAFPSPAANQCDDPATTGATETCAGYELTADLDLSSYANWNPIGGSYTATFEGNGHAISGLTITSNANDDAGLFALLGSAGVIRRVAVTGASVTGTRTSSQELGILAGEVHGTIRFSYTTGTVTSNSNGGWHKTGGLVGHLRRGRIDASYSTATVNGPTTDGTYQLTGGLVGMIGESSGTDTGAVTASYASGRVTAISTSGGRIGGLAGFHRRGAIEYSYAYGRVTATSGSAAVGGVAGDYDGTDASITASYYDSTVTTTQSGTGIGTGQTTRDLKRPTGYSGIYQDWDANVDGVMGNDDPWDFGTPRNYPLLRVDFNGDGDATCREFGRQPCYREPSPPPYNPAHDHPEIYQNARYEMGVSCEVRTTGTGDDAKSTSTLTFDLGAYTRPLTLALSLWDGDVFRSLQSQGISMPELRQEGRMATVEVVTDPAQTRFRLDSEYGLNLVLGYADCHTDDPEE